MVTRRDFLFSSVLPAALMARVPAAAATQYDLVIKGGRVIDPAQKMNGFFDVAIRNGRIAAVRAGIPASEAAEVLDGTGKLVTPGLVDIHAHPRPGELSAERVLAGGVTTVVDGGSRGAENIQDMVDVSDKAPNRLRALINICKKGNFADGELLDLKNVDQDAARNAIRARRNVIVGVKARLSRATAGENDLEAIRLAHKVTKAFGIPLMVHVGDTRSSMPEILALLEPGDIVTHVYSPPPNNIFDNAGRILPPVREARRRGILFDVGHGLNGHFTWETADRALQQDFLPDTITSDLNGNGLIAQVFDFPNVLSKFLLLGMSIDQVVARATVSSARAIPALKELGTLKTGAVADVTVLELVEGNFEFADNIGGKRTGRRRLFARAVVAGGKKWNGEMSPPPPAEPHA
ncbi:MAG TPA: amidohydrolase/deacetylase family metallohydrolase [Terriglobia bacterium]|nr:amidohydrolase/deacetylase family metallohydrolase [Terriglobia bacterium]